MARAATNSWSSRSRKTVTYQQVVAALRVRVQSPCLTPRSPRSDEHGARCIRRWPTARQLASNDPQQGPADAAPRSAFRWSAASYSCQHDTTVIPLGGRPEHRDESVVEAIAQAMNVVLERRQSTRSTKMHCCISRPSRGIADPASKKLY